MTGNNSKKFYFDLPVYAHRAASAFSGSPGRGGAVSVAGSSGNGIGSVVPLSEPMHVSESPVSGYDSKRSNSRDLSFSPLSRDSREVKGLRPPISRLNLPGKYLLYNLVFQ